MTRRLGISWVVAVALLAGCSSSDSPATDASEIGEEYVRAIADGEGAGFATMDRLTSPGSIADQYRLYLQAIVAIEANGGESETSANVDVEAGVVVLTLTRGQGAPVRTEWSDFALDGDGLLEDFTINGLALDDRLVGSSDPVSVGDVSISISSAFRLVSSDNPVVVLVIENNSADDYELLGATYEPPDGRTLQSNPTNGALRVRAGAANQVAMVFEPAELGGTLSLTGVTGEELEHTMPLGGE